MAKKHKRTSTAAVLTRPTLVQTDKHLVKDELGKPTLDSFLNFAAKMGLQSDNLSAYSQYSVGPLISRDRLQLEAMYRSSWLVGQVVDCIAEDMTKDGVNFFSEMKPDDIQKLQVAISEYGIWHELSNTIRWARLYGGAVAVMLIDGAKYNTPLRLEAIGKNKFKGLLVLDRWMLQPSVQELITDISKDMGKPMYYEVLAGVTSMPAQKIHHSRVLRFDGIELPYYQKLFENLWGLSVVERMYDRLLAFDSATTGAAQLLYKAYLRVVGVEGLREALALGGAAENAVIKQFNYIRLMQSNEGITLLDAKDQFNTHQYSFNGVSDLLYQFGQQISGATGIPLVRLFGQSPAGLNSSGESDLRNYYDNVHRQQENDLRPQLDKLFAVIAKSVLEEDLPEDFEFKFVPLWQLSEKEKSDIASADSTTIGGAISSGLISKHTALKELRQNSRITGRFTNITDDEIEEAKNEIPPNAEFGDIPLSGASDVPDTPDEPDTPDDPNERLGGANPNVAKESSEKEHQPIEENVTDAGKSYMGKIRNKFLEYRKRFMTDEAEFKEESHPRKNDGKFAPKGAGESGASEKETKKKESAEKETNKEKEKTESKPVEKTESRSASKPSSEVSTKTTVSKSKTVDPPQRRKGMGDVKIPVGVFTKFPSSASAHLNEDGTFKPERQKLHDKLVTDTLKNIKSSDNPEFVMLGGGTASGKSTAKKNLPYLMKENAYANLDSDYIKESLVPEMIEAKDETWASYSHAESSYVCERMQSAALESNKSFILDGTGNTTKEKVLGIINDAKAAGFKVTGVYSTVSIEEAIRREEARAKNKEESKGRKVCKEILIEKHKMVSALFPDIAPLFDNIQLFDCEVPYGAKPNLILSGENGKITVHNEKAYKAFLDKAYFSDADEDVSWDRKEEILIAAAQGENIAETEDEKVYFNRINPEIQEILEQGFTVDIPFEIPSTSLYKAKSEDEDNFEESKHPRKNDGKFASKGEEGGTGSSSSKSSSEKSSKTGSTRTGTGKPKMEATKVGEDGKRTTASGEPLPSHIAKLKIPPAWTDVSFNPDPKGEQLVRGKDAKGKTQVVYSEKHNMKAAKAKFSRINELNRKFESINKQNEKAIRKNDERAVVLDFIMKTGLRPGSDKDTQAKVKAYGATTLEGRHVQVENGKVTLDFIGKKGVHITLPIQDEGLAKMLKERKKKAGDDGRLFNTDRNNLLRYTSSLDGGGFKTKDFRTLLGTKSAVEVIKEIETPSSEKDYKKKVMQVAKMVSSKLGNTPSMALKAYINPVVFADWRSAVA